MRGERDKDAEALMAAHGIGRRLATRVVALRSRRLDVTATVLAEAASGGPIEDLLLAPEMLRSAASLTERQLQEQARDRGYEQWELLRLVGEGRGGWRVVALQDDVLAEEALAEAEAAPGAVLVRAETGQISARETHELFTPEEVARLKLCVLTSQDADERVEAVRKLVFAPLEGAQKAGIFLNVLIDSEAAPRVRREAIRSLEQIGFRSDMAEAVRGLFLEDAEEAVYAIQRLGVLLAEAEPGEAALALAVILEVFEESRDERTMRELLRLIGGSAAILVSNYQKTEQFVQSALRQLDRDFEELRLDVEGALKACAERAPELMADLLWRELQRTESAAVRGLLLTLSESLAREPGRTAELARLAVQEILNPALPESERARLRYGLVRFGEPAVLTALERVAQASGVERSELIRLLDVLCTESEVSHETVQQAVNVFVDLLKVGDSVTRRSILTASLLAEERIEPPLQRELAEELLALMTEMNLPGTLDAIQGTLERIGTEALAPACRFMRREYPSEPAQRAALAAGAIIQQHPDNVDELVAGELLEVCTALLHDEALEEGAFAIPLAAVCGYTRPGATQFEACLRELRDDVWKLPYAMDALDALGIMGGAPNADPARQRELFELFDGIVRFQARTGMGALKETEEGPVYEFGREMQFDVRAVPSAVKGLERICLSPQAPAELRTAVVKRLLVLWEGVAKVRIIWGPAAIEALVSAMCSAACSQQATAETKVRLGVSLLRFLNKINVIRSIGLIFSQPDESPAMRETALEAGLQVLDEWEESELQDEERNIALLKSVGRIAANPALDVADEQVRRFRERALQALYSGLREGMTEVREPLLLMRDCPDLPPAQKQEIDERLGKAFGLVRIGRSG
jgi:hypothetical protein